MKAKSFKSSVAVRKNSRGKEPASETGRFAVVAIGASAGGLEAYTEFFRALPSDTGMAFVLVQHLDPTHHSPGCSPALPLSTNGNHRIAASTEDDIYSQEWFTCFCPPEHKEKRLCHPLGHCRETADFLGRKLRVAPSLK